MALWQLMSILDAFLKIMIQNFDIFGKGFIMRYVGGFVHFSYFNDDIYTFPILFNQNLLLAPIKAD